MNEFEARKAEEKNNYLSNLANGNELAMVHLGTINEDEDDDDEDEKSFDAEVEAKKQKAAA